MTVLLRNSPVIFPKEERNGGEKVGGEQCEEALGYHGDGYSVKICIL